MLTGIREIEDKDSKDERCKRAQSIIEDYTSRRLKKNLPKH